MIKLSLLIKLISLNLLRFIFLLFIRLVLFIFGVNLLIVDWTILVEWEILSINSVCIEISILIDWMRIIFISFVLLISRVVIFYRKSYMLTDKFINRFVILVLIFVFSIILMIISPNLIRILLGWDGLGLVSFCLVIYYQNIKSLNAGLITALSNRIGDVGLLISIAWMINFGSFNFIFYVEFIYSNKIIEIICGFVILAAITKRAQIPFSRWLPAAMAAPTPVSALVHSSTLVTAGVYLLIRFNPFILLGSSLSQFLLLIGGLTMFISGLGANFEFDLKKIIALSTLSQLGLIIIILSLGLIKLAFFHLLTHAVFKALLFICAGLIIHMVLMCQDIRIIGSLILTIPLTSSVFIVANLSLCGIPFLAGFYSKDLILESSVFLNFNVLMFFIFYFSTGMTVSYSFRLVYYSFTGGFNMGRLNTLNDQEILMLNSKLVLCLFSVVIGCLLSWLIIPSSLLLLIPLKLKFMTLLTCLLGGIIGYLMSFNSLLFFNRAFNLNKLIFFFSLMWFIPLLSSYIIIKLPLLYGNYFIKLVDKGWREFFGTNSLNKFFKYLVILYQLIQTNSLKLYIFRFLIWLVFFLFVGSNYLNSLSLKV